MGVNIPYFNSDNIILNRAARIAAGDIAANCIPFKYGLLTEEKTCIMAGLDYDTPWTRDAAINTMNAICISDKEVAYNTLLSVCEEKQGKTYIGGQYWDAIIWAIGAWQYYLVNTEKDFLKFASNTIANTLEKLENEEFDVDEGLFCGPAVYGDGVAAYPNKYGVIRHHHTGILSWPEYNQEKCNTKGYGIPMKVLSTNCIYYAAYMIEAKMCAILGHDSNSYLCKAQTLKEKINNKFWNKETGRYDYLFDNEIRCDSAEALGLSFAILFEIADKEKCESIIKNTYVTDHGMACVWPSFERYRVGNNYGRHSGTVWPHAQGFWALSMLKSGNCSGFEKELFLMANKSNRDMQFAEIYHPKTGEVYGGVQEKLKNGISVWNSCKKQTWSATAFWSLIYYGLFGLEYGEKAIKVKPYMPLSVDYMELKNLKIGKADITIIADKYVSYPYEITIPKDLEGQHKFFVR